jgi:hypothetical protein|tara:strand:- start:197 stop:721 length:525 start_codon:yes stop_codon:yes gene_type:complete
MSYKIIDNCLPRDEFLKIKNIMLGANLDWYYNDFIAMPGSDLRNDLDDFQFTHTAYKNNIGKVSDLHTVLTPILEILNPSAIVRIKANLRPKSNAIKESEWHYDNDNFDGKVAIFYVNTNNGYTIFEDKNKVQSIENRLVIFDGDTLHTGTTCTDQKVRCLINFMYYNWTDSKL